MDSKCQKWVPTFGVQASPLTPCWERRRHGLIYMTSQEVMPETHGGHLEKDLCIFDIKMDAAILSVVVLVVIWTSMKFQPGVLNLHSHLGLLFAFNGWFRGKRQQDINCWCLCAMKIKQA